MRKLSSSIYKVTITTETGLHIGAGDVGIEIGGIDQQVIKDKEGYPYIPGSSLKGKFRSLVEITEGKYDKKDGGPHKFGGTKECLDGSCLICRAFGAAGVIKTQNEDEKKKLEEKIKLIGPTRMIVRDLFLSPESKKKFKEEKESGENPFEVKTEVMIDRQSGTAARSGPRPLERVPTGTVFEGEIVFRIFDTNGDGKGDCDEKIAKKLFESGLLKKLIENDYLGGQGSRGSGQITIEFDPI